jgi:amidase
MLSGGLAGLNIGVDWQYISRSDDAVVSVVREVLKVFAELGARITEVTMPSAHERLVREWAITCGKECAAAHAAYYPERKREYGPSLAGMIDMGREVTEARYQSLEEQRQIFRHEFDDLLKHVDVFICPCMPSLPPTLSQMEQILDSAHGTANFLTFTAPFNYSGHPTLVLPAGLSDGGLPQSFQLVGRHLGEPTLFRAGSAFEQVIALDERPIA